MDVNKVRNTTIFQGMSEKEIAYALEGLSAVTKKYKKGRPDSIFPSTASRWQITSIWRGPPFQRSLESSGEYRGK